MDATAKPRTATTETDEFGKFARRILKAYSKRVADLDIEGLAGLVRLQEDIDAAIVNAVIELHGTYSWGDIGRVLGITRQAASMRFGARVRAANAAKAAAMDEAGE